MALTPKKLSYVALIVGIVVVFYMGVTFQSKAMTPRAWWDALTTGHVLAGLWSTVLFAVGMEYYARFAHREWWHGPALWWVHTTHHMPGKAAFELNDVFGIANAAAVVPLMFLTYHAPPSYTSALLFGACTGISIFGTAYMVVHDGIHHRRFWVGPLSRVPWLRAVADAHKQHHTKDHTAPFGLFLGPQELAAIARGEEPPPLPAAAQLSLVGWVLGMCGSALLQDTWLT